MKRTLIIILIIIILVFTIRFFFGNYTSKMLSGITISNSQFDVILDSIDDSEKKEEYINTEDLLKKLTPQKRIFKNGSEYNYFLFKFLGGDSHEKEYSLFFPKQNIGIPIQTNYSKNKEKIFFGDITGYNYKTVSFFESNILLTKDYKKLSHISEFPYSVLLKDSKNNIIDIYNIDLISINESRHRAILGFLPGMKHIDYIVEIKKKDSIIPNSFMNTKKHLPKIPQ